MNKKFGDGKSSRPSMTQHSLKLKIGAKVELTYNMNTEIGLSHHSEGIIVDIVKKEGADDILLVEFPTYRGIKGIANEKGENIIVPIMKKEQYCSSLNVIRKNFSLALSFSRTVHSRGLIMDQHFSTVYPLF